MLTVREAARLLAAVSGDSSAGPAQGSAGAGALGALRTALGFHEALRPPRTWRRGLGLEGTGLETRIAGLGALRLLTIDGAGLGAAGSPAGIATLCRTLAREAPTALWLLVAHDRPRHSLVIAAPPPAGRGTTRALAVDTHAVRESDAETLAALAAERSEPEALRHLRWREILGRDALTRRFYRDFAGCVRTLADTAEGRATAEDRHTIAVLHASRLLFLAFLEAKGWLDEDRAFLRRAFEARCGGRGAHRRFLEPLFFGTLNTPPARRAPAARAFGQVPFLNGGLFARTPLESRCRDLRFPDEALGDLVGDLLGRYRLTARETSAEWAEAAVDPEMLGRAFESLMASDARRDGGVFYTPQALIARLTRGAIDLALTGGGGSPSTLEQLRLIDPACGSGAFLVFALEEITARRIAAGDTRRVATIRREVLTRSVFGVDRDPTAVWLCQLRLWLSVVVEDEHPDGVRVAPLPNLDRNIREGDALAGDAFAARIEEGDGPLGALRLRYVRASGARKRLLARQLDRTERACAVAAAEAQVRRIGAERRELLTSLRSRDLFAERRAPDAGVRQHLDALRRAARTAGLALRRLRDGGALPFAFGTHFPELARLGGVDAVIGNPPWVRTVRIPAADRDALRRRFESFRLAAWREGAAAAAAGHGFASQADLAALFVERAVQLARPGGVIALLVPAKLWSALAGGGIRRLLARDAPVLSVEHWPDGGGGFDAVVYPSALLARRGPADAGSAGPARPAGPARVAVARHEATRTIRWTTPRARLGLDGSPGAPWLLVPGEVRDAFDALAAHGTPLAASRFGRPLLGVKTGCNAAFLVERDPDRSGDATSACVSSGGRRGLVERALLRPVLRGEDLRAFSRQRGGGSRVILWTHGDDGAALPALPPDARRWLAPSRRRLEQRADSRGARWWALFRTESARADQARVCWCDIGLRPRAVVLPAGDESVPLNSCYVARAPTLADAHALAALLNSRVVAAWLGVIAEPARGGYHRYLGWTCARLPLPRDWDGARDRLAEAGAAAAAAASSPEAIAPDDGDMRLGDALDDALDDEVCDAYGIAPSTLAPLLAWTRR